MNTNMDRSKPRRGGSNLRLRARRLIAVAAAASAALVLRRSARAAADTWVGNTSNDWNAANWTDSGGGNTVSSGDSLFFAGNGSSGTTLTDTLAGGFSIGNITFTAIAPAYTQGGNAFNLTGSITNNSTSLETINNGISLPAVETISTIGGGNITLGGNISGASGGLTIAGPATVLLSGIDSYNGNTTVNAGTLSLTGSLSSSSSLLLGGGTFSYAPGSANSQTLNGLTLNAGSSAVSVNANGTLNLGNITHNMGGTVVFTIASGGNIAVGNSVGNSTTSPYGILGPWALVNSGGTATNNSSAGYTYATVSGGNITPYTGAMAESNANIPNTSTSSNNWDWNETGSAAADFGSSRTVNTIRYTGSENLSLGDGGGNTSYTLTMNGLLNAGTGSFLIGTNSTVGDTGAINVVVGGNNNNELILAAETNLIEIDTSIQNNGSTPGAVTVTGAHSVILKGANTFSGGLYYDGSGGSLQIDSPTALGNGTFTIQSGTLTNSSGSAISESNNNAQAWNGDFTFTGFSGNTTGDINLGTGAVTLGGSRVVTATAGTLTVGGAIGDSGSGYSLAKAGAGALILSGTSTYSGGTTLNAGILVAAASTATGGGAITGGPVGTGTLSLNGGTIEDNGTAITLANPVSIGGNITFASTGSGNLTFDGTGLTAPATVAVTANTTLTVNNTTTIKDSISGGSSLNITKAGAGTLVLAGSNTYSGALSFGGNNTGTIVLGNTSALAVSSAQLYFGPYTGNTLDIATNGNDYPFATNSTTGFSATILVDRATQGAGINHPLGQASYAGGNVTFAPGSNVISGNASITYASLSLVSGNGNATLASLTLIPTTTATAGTFVSIGNVTATNNAAKALILDGNSTGNIITGAITDGVNAALSITKSNTSTWTLSGSNSYSGATTVNGGTLRINGLNSGAGNVTVSSGATLGGNGTIGVASTGNGTITVSGGNITAGSNSTTSGTLTSLSTNGVTISGGSGYIWKLNNGNGSAGTSSGWDEIATRGLTFSSLSAGGNFTVYITGTPTGLQPGTTTYVIATDPSGPIAVNSIGAQGNGTILAGAGVASADSGLFALNTNGFSASASPVVGSSSSFQLELIGDGSGQDLALVYSATPEPGTALLVLGGTVPILLARRRRRTSLSGLCTMSSRGTSIEDLP